MKGVAAIAVGAVVPRLTPEPHPLAAEVIEWHHVTYGKRHVVANDMMSISEVSRSLSEALARSIMQTRDRIAADVVSQAFGREQ